MPGLGARRLRSWVTVRGFICSLAHRRFRFKLNADYIALDLARVASITLRPSQRLATGTDD